MDKASHEWYIREGYGRIQARLWAAEALVSRTAEQIWKLIHAPREELTQQARGEVAVRKSISALTVTCITIVLNSAQGGGIEGLLPLRLHSG